MGIAAGGQHIMSFLLYKKKTAGHWALLLVHRSEQEDIQRNQCECVEKDQPPFQANALIYNEWQQGSSPVVKEMSRAYSSNVVVMTYLLCQWQIQTKFLSSSYLSDAEAIQSNLF